MSRGDDPTIQEYGQYFDDHIEVEEHDDLFPPDRGIFRPYVVDHDERHENRCNVNHT